MRHLLVILAICGALQARTVHRQPTIRMNATAFYKHGKTALGTQSRPGTAAADPRVLPLGTLVRVRNAGPYSGEYRITDTGSAIRGRRIDLRVPSLGAAKRFGRRLVLVEVLKNSPVESGPE